MMFFKIPKKFSKNIWKLFTNVYICYMSLKKSEPTKMVRISERVVDKVAKRKAKTGVPVGKFFEQAALEKLKSEKQ